MTNLSNQLVNAQTLTVSPRTIQEAELIQLPQLALEERQRQEMENNPLLEEIDPDSNGTDDTLEDQGEDSSTEPAADNGDEATLDETLAESDEWGEDSLPIPGAGTRSFDSDEESRDYWLNTPSPPPDLAEQINAEITAADLPARQCELARMLADELDESGYLRTQLADLAMCHDAELPELEAALEFIQSLDPAGIGARSLAECLKLQLQRRGELTPLLEKILTDGLDDVAHNRLPALARRFDTNLEDLKAALAVLKTLDPAPGAVLTATPAECVTPELEFVKTEQGYKARRLGEHRDRPIVISARYHKLLGTPDLSDEDRAYLREKLQRAREFIKALAKRKTVIQGLGDVIASRQSAFMEDGVRALKPLTEEQAAKEMGVDASTVSRAAADKYAATPQGIFPLKYFFSAGYSRGGGEDGGEAISNRAVMEKIRALIAAEDPEHPLSDEKLAGMLHQDGIDIARRTVAKYRDKLRIPSTGQRRRH